jgi:hypothetical protein
MVAVGIPAGRRRLGSVIRNLVLVALVGITRVLLILILRLLVLGLLLLLRLLLLVRRLLRRWLRTLRWISRSSRWLLSSSRVGGGTRRNLTLIHRGSSTVVADRREVSILRRVYLIAIVLVATGRQNSQHQHG